MLSSRTARAMRGGTRVIGRPPCCSFLSAPSSLPVEQGSMSFEPGNTSHGLPYDPFKSCVVPRPIGWISTVDAEGNYNLAPYSQFQNVTFNPPIVMFAANQDSKGCRKDS